MIHVNVSICAIEDKHSFKDLILVFNISKTNKLGTIHKLRNRDMGRGGSVKVLQGAYGGEGGSPQKL